MKKKWLIAIASCALAVTVALGISACGGDDESGKSDEEIAQTAISMLNNLYLKDGKVRNYETPDDFKRLGQVTVESTACAVVWTADVKTAGYADYVKVGTEKDSGNQITIDVSRATVDIEYTLTASVTVNEATKTTSYEHKIPKKSSETSETATLDLSKKDATRTQYDANNNIQVWSQNGVTLTNTGSVADYEPIRLYKNTTVKIEMEGADIIHIDFHSAQGYSDSPYPDWLKQSLEDSDLPIKGEIAVSEDGLTISVDFETPLENVTFKTTAGQCRLTSIDVEGNVRTHTHQWTYEHIEGTWTHKATCTAEGCDVKTRTEDCSPVLNECACGYTYTAKEIVDALFALETGKSLPGSYTLTGVVTEVTELNTTQYYNVTFKMTVEDHEITVYRAKGDHYTEVAVGGTATVNGELLDYSGTKEFTQGGSVVAFEPGVDERSPQEKVTAALNALASTFTVTKTGETALPTANIAGVTFTWATTDQTYTITNNKINVTELPESDATVNATVTATYGNETLTDNTKQVTITIKAKSTTPVEGDLVLTTETLFAGITGNGYSPYNGAHTVGGAEVTTSNVLGTDNYYNGTSNLPFGFTVMQFKKTEGTLSLTGTFTKIVVVITTSYDYDSADKLTVTAGSTTLAETTHSEADANFSDGSYSWKLYTIEYDVTTSGEQTITFKGAAHAVYVKSITLTGSVSGGGETPEPGPGGDDDEEGLIYTLVSTVKGENSNENDIGNYTVSSPCTVDGILWDVLGNTNIGPSSPAVSNWRFGGKAANCNPADRTITGRGAIVGTVKSIKITFGATNGITVNSVTLKVYSTDPGTGSPSAIATKTVTWAENGSFTVTADDDGWTNCYYQLVMNLSTEETSNKWIVVDNIKFYGGEGTGTQPGGDGGDETPHVCGHVCDICGKCTDLDCDDPVCEDKCEGHTLAATDFPTTDFETLNADTNPQADKYYYATGIVKSITEAYNATIIIVDEEGNTFQIYGLLNEDGSVRYGQSPLVETVLKSGDSIVVFGSLTVYNGTVQMSNAWLVQINDEAKTDAAKLLLTTIVVASPVTEDFDLPTEGGKIVWTVSSGNGISVSGGKATVTRSTVDQTVVLRATATVGAASASKDFTVVVTKKVEGQESVTLTVDTLQIPSGKYTNSGSATVGGVEFNWIGMGNYGDGLQWRTNSGTGTSTISNAEAFSGKILKVVLVWTTTSKEPATNKSNHLKIELATDADFSDASTQYVTFAADKAPITLDLASDEYTFIRISHNNQGAVYLDHIEIIYDTTGGSAPTESDKDKVDAATSALNLDKLTLTSVGDSITLPATQGEANVTWKMEPSESSYVTLADGKLTVSTLPTDADATVKLTATLTVNSETSTKDFTVTISKAATTPTETAQEKVEKALEDVDNEYSVTAAGDYDLPACNVDGVEFSWTVDAEHADTYTVENGKLKVGDDLPAEETVLTLTLTAKCGDEYSTTKTVTITISAKAVEPEPTHEMTATYDPTVRGHVLNDDMDKVTDKVKDVSVTFAKGDGTTPTFYTTEVRVYLNGTFTVSVPEGYKITAITLTYTETNAVTADVGTLSGKAWTGSATAVVFTVGAKSSGTGGHIKLTKIEVTYLSPVEECAHASLTKTSGTPAECEKAGVADYWTCDECDRMFSKGEAPTDDDEIFIPQAIEALGHAYSQWTDDGDGSHHTATCDNCHTEQSTELHDKLGEGGKCSKCGGEMTATMKDVTLELTQSTLGLTNVSYGDNNKDHTVGDFEITTNQVMANSTNIQMQKGNGKGSISNKTSFPGRIKSIVIVFASTQSSGTIKLDLGTTADLGTAKSLTMSSTQTFTADEGTDFRFFKLYDPSAAAYIESITITYETLDTGAAAVAAPAEVALLPSNKD